MSDSLYHLLSEYSKEEYYPFHMPGHKRSEQSGALAGWNAIDITEIDGFDNLHQPQTIIWDAQQRARKLYGSEESYFLINGSTAGVLSAVSALKSTAKKLIIARNCHKAVYHAAFLNRKELHYVYPEKIQDYDMLGAISAQDIRAEIERILAKQNLTKAEACQMIAGVVITSPTYDGIVSDVSEISRLVHQYGLPLIVDQAHGAHFGMHPDFPENAVREGADIVIHSVHKTLPAPTQTALIHRSGSLINKEQLQKYLAIYQTSSPSYLLMAGIDEAVRIAQQEAESRLSELLVLRKRFLHQVEGCRFITICPYTEPGKIMISVRGSSMSGQELYDILRKKYHLQMEMAGESYVVAIVTMMDTQEGFQRLAIALTEIDEILQQSLSETAIPLFYHKPEVRMPLWKAYDLPNVEIELEKAENQIAASFINLYPPGIPLLVPGEKIQKDILEGISNYLINGYVVQGVEHNKIKVVCLSK